MNEELQQEYIIQNKNLLEKNLNASKLRYENYCKNCIQKFWEQLRDEVDEKTGDEMNLELNNLNILRAPTMGKPSEN